MLNIDRLQLERVLAEYAARNPGQATLEGDEFIIKPRRLGTLTMMAFVITGLSMALAVTLGIGIVIVTLVIDTIEDRWLLFASGIGMILAGVLVTFVLVNSRVSRGVIDLRSGDYTMRSILRTRKVTNLADVTAVNRSDTATATATGAGGGPVFVSWFIEFPVAGADGPKTAKAALAMFNNTNALEQFEPVVNALIDYFRVPR